MPDIDLLPPILALTASFVIALAIRLYLALASRRDARRSEQVLRRLSQHEKTRQPVPETHDA